MNFGYGLSDNKRHELLTNLRESRRQLYLWIRGVATPPCGTGLTTDGRYGLIVVLERAIRQLECGL